MTRSEVTAVKQFLSKQDDIYREPYGRRTIKFPRRCVFCGTTNDSEFLRDRTGNRRFWPVELNPEAARYSVFNDLTNDVVDQLWAEGLEAWRQGEDLYLTGKAAEMALEYQEAHLESNPKEGWIRDYLDKEIPLNWHALSLMQRRSFLAGDFKSDVETKLRDRICVAEVWEECLNGDRRWLKRVDSIEINSILSTLPEWEKTKNSIQFAHYGKQKGFVRVELSAKEKRFRKKYGFSG
jgi:putative DNA primase/helicase